MIYHDSLQQNATDIITKCDGYFIAKYDRSLLQMRQVSYYKMRQLLQIATILITKCDIYYKCHVYYKLQQYVVFIYSYPWIDILLCLIIH